MNGGDMNPAETYRYEHYDPNDRRLGGAACLRA